MSGKSDPNVFQSLFARLTPSRHDGFTVTCTATQRVLGEVFWTASGSTVTWSFRATTGAVGDRSTKRGAVQSLRDVANGITGHPLLPFDAVAPAPRPAPAARQVTALPAPATTPKAPAISQKVQWDQYPARTDVNVGDLTRAIASALNRQK